jgi:hypothetical protein
MITQEQINKQYKDMCDQCGRINMMPICNNGNCEDYNQSDNVYCVDKKSNKAIAPILDCQTHWEICMDDCHSECACQNP